MKKIAIGICADCPLDCKLRVPAGRIPLVCPLPNAGPEDYGYEVEELNGEEKSGDSCLRRNDTEGTSETHVPTEADAEGYELSCEEEA